MIERAAFSMGTDKIRYLVFTHGRWKWRPTKAMRAAGFYAINLSRGTIVNGRNVPTAADEAQALALNKDWDRHRMGLPAAGVEDHSYPHGSVGHGYKRAMRLRESERRAKGIVWTKEQHSRDDWPRAWKWIEPLFADCDPKTITPEQLIGNEDQSILGLRPLVAIKVSESEAHRVIKVWRALWKKMAVFGYCDRDKDPSLLFANSAPAPRKAIWSEGEAVRLVKRSWREGYHGLAALLAVAWDSQLSPVDARGLSADNMRKDPIGTWFDVARAKTGREALATLSRRTERVLRGYLETLGAEPIGSAPVFRNRSGAPYSKDTLGDDFRTIRRIEHGPDDTRQLADFRRSGAVEAISGSVDPAGLSSKMANTLSASNRLHKTYSPAQLTQVREADKARQRGRALLRGTKTAQKCPGAGPKVSGQYPEKR